MATHRRGISATQWSVGDLLRREGRSWPSLSPAARGVAVGSALLASTVVAVSMASEPEPPEPPPPPDPGPPAAAPDTPTPAPETAPPAAGTGSRYTAHRGSPFEAQETTDGPAVALAPAMPAVRVPHTPSARSALPDLSGPDADDAPVVGEDIVAGALDPDTRTEPDDKTAHDGDAARRRRTRQPPRPARAGPDRPVEREFPDDGRARRLVPPRTRR